MEGGPEGLSGHTKPIAIRVSLIRRRFSLMGRIDSLLVPKHSLFHRAGNWLLNRLKSAIF